MRDVVITLIVLVSLYYTFKRPHIGALMWVWISVMNPHRLSYGFAYTFPFAAIIAAATLIGLVLSREPKNLPMTPIVVTLLLFTAWMAFGTLFAFNPDGAYTMLSRVMKIMLMTFVIIMLIRDKQQIHQLIWVLLGSMGYYGIKGGVFSIISGGSFRVWGPEGTFIEGNNELALALIAVIPLFYYCYLQATDKRLRYAWGAAILLCGLSALCSYSRGALLGIVAMVLFLWLKAPKKLPLAIALAVIIPAAVAFMPAQWGERMNTVKEYKEDGSAMGRINAWYMTANLAASRPPLGGSFDIYDIPTFERFAPEPKDIHAAHSLYFQALGEHGYMGLALYLTLGALVWRAGSRIKKRVRDRPDLKWAGTLATMLQVGMIGFGTGGAFLSLLYFDVPYYMLALMVATDRLVDAETRQEQRSKKPHSQVSLPGRGAMAPTSEH